MKTTLKTTLEFLPLATLVYVFVSYFYLDSYYSAFGLVIVNYIHYSELLFAFVPALFTLLIITIGFSAFIYSKVFHSIPGTVNHELHENLPTFSLKHYKLFPSSLQLIILLGWIASLTGLIGGLVGISHLYDMYEAFVGKIFMICALLTYSLLPFLSPRDGRKFIGWMGAAFIVISFYALLEGRKLEAEFNMHNKTKPNIHFTYSNKWVHTDSSYYPIGEASDYIFFYNKKSKQTLVYKRSNIDSLIVSPPE
jgi:hypothetical protein